MWNKTSVKTGVVAVYVATLTLPFYVFFSNRSGFEFLTGLSGIDTLKVIFPILGLYAFTFVSLQLLLTINLPWLKKYWPELVTWHRFQGWFAVLFAILHPLTILIGYGIAGYLDHLYVADAKKYFVLPAYAGLTILMSTVLISLLAWQGMKLPNWRILKWLNYIVFGLVFVHSWFIGTDTPGSLLRALWLTYLAAVIVSTIVRYWPALSKPRVSTDIRA
ncbi:MAG TPA: ferric reductase-like transmembrane domain-containing protein [Candidatus Saccharimonadales bacterium]|nr:ferric reductase-like transmembrane domain-containing protein [Candidatus Saccharimonadales bacterium]